MLLLLLLLFAAESANDVFVNCIVHDLAETIPLGMVDAQWRQLCMLSMILIAFVVL